MSGPVVRPIRLSEVGVRIDYFYGASDEYLRMLGVERSRLPSREDWLAGYEREFALPITRWVLERPR